MTRSKATSLWLAVGVVASIAFAAWAVNVYLDSVDASQTAVADVSEAERLRAQILAGRAGGENAHSASVNAVDLSRSLSDALTAAGVEADHIAQVGAADSRPVPGSPFVERRSAVTIRSVTIAQAVALIRSLDSEAGLSVRDLRLAAPPHADDDLWDLELTLSTLSRRPAEQRETSADSGTP